jgi:ech hydrogenase subunit E
VEKERTLSYLLPLGPFHPALRTPQRIVLRAQGDTIEDVEHRDGYTSRNIAERVRRADLVRSYPLINRICGVHSHHHALAWTIALEQLAGIDVPPRAEILRTVAAELERAASHLHTVAIAFDLLGLGQVQRQLGALREWVLAAMQHLTGHRLVVDFARPGGVSVDLTNEERAAMQRLIAKPADVLYRLIDRTIRRRSFTQRVIGIGALQQAAAEALGVTGPLGRASGIQRDLRADEPYAAYAAIKPAPVTQTGGDTYARLMLLLLEAYDSLQLVLKLLANLPDGDWQGEPIAALPAGTQRVAVEAPAGPLHYTLQSDGTRLTTIDIELVGGTPRLVLRALLAGQLVENAAIIIASANMCAACGEV